MILTIGMIVKNEGENLGKCLSALQPIRDAVESELIIVDTGSTDNTVEIANKYADEVRYFEWCKNFAAARNESLRGAKGEWFMFLDADETFGDSSDLTEFFTSGEYKQYNSASFIIRNYMDKETERFLEVPILRTFKIYPETTFVKPIHEYLKTKSEPAKMLNSYIDHTGYADLGADSPKRLNYIEILEKEVRETGGKEVIAFMQLFDSHYVHDNKKAEEYCKKGIAANAKFGYNPLLDYVFMKGIALARTSSEDYDSALKIIAEYFQKKAKDRNFKSVIATDIEMYFLKAYCSVYANKFPQAQSAAKKYNELYAKYKKGQFRTPDLLSSPPRFLNDDAFEDINAMVEKNAENDNAIIHTEHIGDIILTIGMIVKNEGANLENCLSALQPIRDKVRSELIIVDTGSTDNTVEIAKKYADEVRYFEWCKDFAAARNESLKGAKGEWFMYLDGDETFGDCEDLIAFFTTGEYKKYNSASYVQRNYTTKELQNGYFLDAPILRMGKIFPETKFVKPVHEYLNTRGEPVKILNSFVHHTGYVTLGDGADNAKRLSYIEILEKEVKDTGGKEVITFMQLFDVHYVYDNKKAEEYCKKGIEVNTKLRYNTFLNYVFMKGIALARTNSKDYEGALKIIAEYFQKKAKDRNLKDVMATDIEMYYLRAFCSASLKKMPQAESSVKKYNELYLKYKKGQYRTPDLLSSPPRFLNDEEYNNINMMIGGNNANNRSNTNSGGNNTGVVLTIGMIVKNEEATLEKCLQSLMPIKEAVNTELIIVDTGSTDKTVEIAEKYADEIRNFVWINDFAAARNVSLKDAKGEWFMLIDGDEWFGDSSELIEFFKSGEYKRYNSASYLQRNYTTTNINGRYSDGVVLRMTKILPETEFLSPIHEYMNTSGGIIKNLNSYVHHFGYLDLYKDDSVKRKRNEELLLKKLSEVDTGEDEAQICQQLHDIYYGFDNEKAISFSERGIKAAERGTNIYYAYILRKTIIAAYNHERKFEKSAEVIKDYFKTKAADKKVEPVINTDIDIYALKCVAYCNIDVMEAVSAYDKFVELYKKFTKGAIKSGDIYFDIVHFANDVEVLNITLVLVQALARAGKYNTAYEYGKGIPYKRINDGFGVGYLRTKIRDDFLVAAGLKKYSIIEDMAKQLSGDESLKNTMEEVLLDVLPSVQNKDETSFELSENADKYGFSDKFRRSMILHNANGVITESYIQSVIDGLDTLPTYLADIIYQSIKNNILVSEVLAKTDSEKFPQYYSYSSNRDEFLRAIRSFAEREEADNITHFEYARKARAALFAIKNIPYLTDSEHFNLYTLFAYYMMAFGEAVYKPEVFQNEELTKALPKESQVGFYSFMALSAFDNKDVKTCVANLKKAALADIGLKKTVSVVGKMFK